MKRIIKFKKSKTKRRQEMMEQQGIRYYNFVFPIETFEKFIKIAENKGLKPNELLLKLVEIAINENCLDQEIKEASFLDTYTGDSI
jgi:hypothetical protein